MTIRDFNPPPGLRYWLGSYTQDGARYSITIPAPTAEQAEAVLHNVYADASIDGEAMGTVSAI